MKVCFTRDGWEDYAHWAEADRKVLAHVNRLVGDIRRDPFAGLGKPEPLKGALAGWWSRRITAEHRLVYRVVGTDPDRRVEIIQARYHY